MSKAGTSAIDEMTELVSVREVPMGKPGVSDGSTASYYELPAGATQLQDLISHRNMNAQDGEIFRAIYRKGHCAHSALLREAKKVLFYAQAEVERLEKLEPAQPVPDDMHDTQIEELGARSNLALSLRKAAAKAELLGDRNLAATLAALADRTAPGRD